MFNLSTPKAISTAFKASAHVINRELDQWSAEQSATKEQTAQANQIKLATLRERATQKNAERASSAAEVMATNAVTDERINYEANLKLLGITK